MPLTLNEILEKNRQTGRGFDQHGTPRALTAKEFFEISNEAGWNQLNPAYRHAIERLAFWVNAQLGIQSSLEIGAGPGYLMHCLNRLGFRATGIDGNIHSRNLFRTLHPEHAHRYVLDPLFKRRHGRVDAVFSIEVFEHINDDALASIMTKIRDVNTPRYIVFSSTPHAAPEPDWDCQWGHVNLKQPAEWDEFFSHYGFERLPRLKPPITEWACTYVNTRLKNPEFNH